MALLLPTTTITTAGTVVGSVFQLRGGSMDRNLPASMSVLGVFAYGSGGTTANAYIQTSLDGGTTWCDAITFGFLVAVNTKIATINSGKSVVPALATDGTGTVNTVTDGLFGPLWRVKLISTGTYATSTTLTVNAWSNGLVPSP